MFINKYRRRLALTIPFAVLSLLSTAFAAPPSYEELCQQGRQQLAAKQYQEAKDTYTQAIALSPKDSLAYFGRAFASRGLGKYDEVIRDCSEVLRIAPKMPEALAERAAAYYELKDYQEARKDFTDVLNLNFREPRIYLGRAKVLHAIKDFDLAIVDYSRVIDDDPKNVHAWTGRARAYYEKEDYGQALADLARAAELEPDFAQHRYRRAVIFYETKNFERAMEEAAAAVKSEPRFAAAWGLQGVANYQLGHHDEATNALKKAIELLPADPQARVWHGRVLLAQDRFQDAIKAFREAVRIDDNYVPAYRELAKAYEKIDDKKLAEENRRKAEELTPTEKPPEEKKQSEAQLFAARLRSLLPGSADKRLHETTSSPEKQQEAAELMAREAQRRLDGERQIAEAFRQTMESIELSETVPQEWKAATDVLKRGAELTEKGDFEIAAKTFHYGKLRLDDAAQAYNQKVAANPGLWLTWTHQKAERVMDRRQGWRMWQLMAQVHHDAGDQAGYSSAMKKAVAAVQSKGLLDPKEAIPAMLELVDAQLLCHDKELAQKTARAAAEFAEAVTDHWQCCSLSARCAGYAARTGDQATWSRCLEVSKRAADTVGKNPRYGKHEARHLYAAAVSVAYAEARDPENAFSSARELDSGGSWGPAPAKVAPVYARVAQSAVLAGKEDRSFEEIFQKSYVLACSNLGCMFSSQRDPTELSRLLLAQADACRGACSRAWASALNLPDPDARMVVMTLVLRKKAELHRWEEIEDIAAELCRNQAIPEIHRWLGEAKARGGSRSSVDLRLWVEQLPEPASRASTLAGIAVAARSGALGHSAQTAEPAEETKTADSEDRNGGSQTGPSNNPPELSPSQDANKQDRQRPIDKSEIAKADWWYCRAVKVTEKVNEPRVRMALWTRLAWVPAKTGDDAAYRRCIEKATDCAVAVGRELSAKRPEPGPSPSSDYSWPSDFRREKDETGQITAMLPLLLDLEECQRLLFEDKEGAFETLLLVLKQAELLPRDSGHTPPNLSQSSSAWYAHITGYFRLLGKQQCAQSMLANNPWGPRLGSNRIKPYYHAVAAAKTGDTQAIQEYLSNAKLRTNEYAADMYAQLATIAARKGDEEAFRKAAIAVGGLVSGRNDPASKEALLTLAKAAANLGEFDVALQYVEEANIRSHQSEATLATIACAMARKGQVAEAKQIAADLQDNAARVQAWFAIRKLEGAGQSAPLVELSEEIDAQTNDADKAASFAGVAAALVPK